MSPTPVAARDRDRNAAIDKARQEWECTADALGGVVCLLDSDGVVLRANRVVEQWGLGSVRGVLGKTAHSMLHPVCADPHCMVERGLEEALPKLQGGEPHEFECHSPHGDRSLKITLRPLPRTDGTSVAPRDTRTVLLVTDLSALRRAEHELQAARNDLALLAGQLIQAQEGERRRIALELHDSVGQSLSAVKYTLERAIVMIQKPGLGNAESVLTLAMQRIHETADGIRAISMNLRPTLLDTLGAASAVGSFCRDFAEIYPTLAVHAVISAQNAEIPGRISTHLFRCVQELLNNVAKHARAHSVWIALKRDGLVLTLEIRDDGIGMPGVVDDPSRLPGSGLRNLHERAELTAGRFSLTSEPGRGTSAQIVWLLAAAESAGDVA